MFKTTYKCNLLSITPKIEVYTDNRETNIANAETQIVKEIMVYPTDDVGYVREIITNKLIPARRIVEFIEGPSIVLGCGESSCFVGYKMRALDMSKPFSYRDGIEEATKNEVKEYRRKHNSQIDFLNELNYLFQQAEQYYIDACKKREENLKNAEELIKIFRKKIK